MNPLEHKVDADLDWRFAELFLMKLQIIGVPKGSQAEVALLRAAWALLYAHYEGFIKYILREYLELIESGNRSRDELCEQLIVYSLKSTFARLRNNCSDFQLYREAMEKFKAAMAEPIRFQRNDRKEILLPGENNLNARALVECLSIVGIDLDFAANERTRLNALVGRRNEIAHGQKSTIRDRDEYFDYAKMVTGAMCEFGIAMVGIGESIESTLFSI